jgi:hypothetical protein
MIMPVTAPPSFAVSASSILPLRIGRADMPSHKDRPGINTIKPRDRRLPPPPLPAQPSSEAHGTGRHTAHDGGETIM